MSASVCLNVGCAVSLSHEMPVFVDIHGPDR